MATRVGATYPVIHFDNRSQWFRKRSGPANCCKNTSEGSKKQVMKRKYLHSFGSQDYLEAFACADDYDDLQK